MIAFGSIIWNCETWTQTKCSIESLDKRGYVFYARMLGRKKIKWIHLYSQHRWLKRTKSSDINKWLKNAHGMVLFIWSESTGKPR